MRNFNRLCKRIDRNRNLHHTIPSFKICPTCKIEGKLLIEESDGISGKKTHELDPDINLSENRELLNSVLNELELTPLKLHAVPAHESIRKAAKEFKVSKRTI